MASNFACHSFKTHEGGKEGKGERKWKKPRP